MSDELRVYEQTLVRLNDNHASAVRRTRYNPWRLGVYVSLASALPLAAGLGGYQLQGQLGAVVGLVLALPVPFFVLLYAVDGLRVEHQRMVAERQLLMDGPRLPELPVSTSDPVPTSEESPLRPGLLVNGSVVSPLPTLSAEKARLKAACLKLVRAGSERGSWTRAAIAEGVDQMLTGDEWDLASPALQAWGYFWNKPGKGGGLRPSDKLTVAQIIERLEAAL